MPEHPPQPTAPPDLHRRAERRERPGHRPDRGQASLEFLGFFAVLLLVALIAIQVGIVGYTAQQAGTAARVAARVQALDDGNDGAGAGRAAISGWLSSHTAITGAGGGPGSSQVTMTTRIAVPQLVPGLLGNLTVTRSATMPRDRSNDQ
ncbi:TadE/TadG family type IV pilus assembly protein [Streptomyces sp. NPDC006879]|uniref:TadE/TadG family type IV pilus assembly protein n=1 Tax=Streptomyces sp. NPDC006879 TaxID=3364767 RepID=UPI0036A80CCE